MRYIQGQLDGDTYYLAEVTSGIDWSEDFHWTLNEAEKFIGTWDEVCNILDEVFYEGQFHGISGTIMEVTP